MKEVPFDEFRTAISEAEISAFQEELSSYAIGLSQWARRLAQRIQLPVNSYVETYRVAVQESMLGMNSQIDPAELRDDIQILLTGEAQS